MKHILRVKTRSKNIRVDPCTPHERRLGGRALNAHLRLTGMDPNSDPLGRVCLFIRPAFVKKPELLAKLLNARYGWNLSFQDVQQMGVECLETEWEFNNLAGVGSDRCDVPEFMRDEPLPPHNTVFQYSEGRYGGHRVDPSR